MKLLIAIFAIVLFLAFLPEYPARVITEPASEPATFIPVSLVPKDTAAPIYLRASLKLLQSPKARYVTRRKQIPKSVLHHFKVKDENTMGLGDSTDDNVSLGCTQMNTDYCKLLQFGYCTDSACLLVYMQGGFATYRVLSFVPVRATDKAWHVDLSYEVENTKQLESFLQTPEKFEQ